MARQRDRFSSLSAKPGGFEENRGALIVEAGDKGIRKSEKLLKRSEFLGLSRNGKSVHNRYFVAVFQPNQCGRTRLGITVTKKVGNAVTRNRIKRIVREGFRLNRHLFAENRDINVIAKRQAADATGPQAMAALRALFGKIEGGQN